METYRLPADTGNRLINTFIKAEEISNGRVGYSAYGPCLNSRLPNGVHLNFSVDPYIYFASDIQNPEKVENFTVRFIVYTEKVTSEGIMAVELSAKDIENLLNPTDEKMRSICEQLKEMNGLEIQVSRKEYMEAEDAVCERERLEIRALNRQAEEENGFSAPSLCNY